MKKSDTSTTSTFTNIPLNVEGIEGREGTLKAKVIEGLESTHIGDLFRGLYPNTPTTGQVLTLGTGELFTEQQEEEIIGVGLEPADGRLKDWLNPQALYNCHESLVELIFEPAVKTPNN